MIDIELTDILREGKTLYQLTNEIGIWLDERMTNPPKPEEQRWTLGYNVDGRVGIRFQNDQDATYFLLRWQ